MSNGPCWELSDSEIYGSLGESFIRSHDMLGELQLSKDTSNGNSLGTVAPETDSIDSGYAVEEDI